MIPLSVKPHPPTRKCVSNFLNLCNFRLFNICEQDTKLQYEQKNIL